MKHSETTQRWRVRTDNYKMNNGGTFNTASPIGFNYLLGYCDRHQEANKRGKIDITITPAMRLKNY
jgi:hypothetical protein